MVGDDNGFVRNSINDGFFELKYEENGVWLIVHPPVGKGKRVELNDVIDRLSRKKMIDFNRSLVESGVLKADKNPVKIAHSQQEIKIDASLSVTVSPDKMKCSIVLTPPDGGNLITVDKIMNELDTQGVVFGIDTDTIETIVKYPVYNQPISVAKGTYAENGQRGKVNFYFDLNREWKPTILEDGRVDFRELNLVENVKKGQKLCSLIPPSSGKNGRTIQGTNIPALDGKPTKLPKGRNVEISEDGQYLLSTIDGQVNYIDARVSVFF